MATQTQNYGLIKAEETDYVDETIVQNFNTNWDKIDATLKSQSDQISEHMADTAPHQFIDEAAQKTYKYGFRKQDNHLVFMYEEVV